MNDKERHKLIGELRELLESWYSGEGNETLERRIDGLFRCIDELPADLRADRELFAAMQQEAGEEVSMAPDAERRLEAAMSAAFREDSATRQRKLRFPRLAIAISAAACMLIILSAVTFLFRDDHAGIAPSRPAPGMATASTVETDDSTTPAPILPASPLEARAEVPRHANSITPNPAANAAPAPSKADAQTDSVITPAYPSAEDYIISLSEEEELLAEENYRVVVDEREANSIISSIFSRIDENIDRQHLQENSIRNEYSHHTKL